MTLAIEGLPLRADGLFLLHPAVADARVKPRRTCRLRLVRTKNAPRHRAGCSQSFPGPLVALFENCSRACTQLERVSIGDK